MLQVLSREEEAILDLHITGIFQIVSNSGDLQWNQTLGTCFQGIGLWGSPTIPTVDKSKTNPLLGGLHAVAYSLVQTAPVALMLGMDWARGALGELLLDQTSLNCLPSHPEDD